MRIYFAFLGLLLFPLASLGQTSHAIAPQVVTIPSGNLRLKAYFWTPEGSGPFPAVLFNHGSGGATADITAGMQITGAAEILAPFFLKHGYGFLYLFRRGQGLSADQAPFLQDVLRRDEERNGNYSTTAGRALADELRRLDKPYVLKIYPAVGLTPNDGHNMLYTNIPAWQDDVFNFLDQYLKR